MDTNVEKDGYKFWYRFDRIDYEFDRWWIQMLISIGLKDGYKCYDGLWIW